MDRLEVTKDVLGHWLSQDLKKLGWWVDLVFLSDNQGVVHMNLSDLAKRWDSNKMTVSRFLDRLNGETICDTKVLRKAGVITIYQSKSCVGSKNEVCYESVTGQESPLISLSPTPPISFNPKENIIDDNNAHTHEENFGLIVGVIASEETFIRRYQQEGLWAEAAISSHLTEAQVQQIFADFIVEQKHNSSRHRDYADFKRHFLNYLRVKAEILRRQNKQGYGNNNGQNQRRGVQVVANSPEDYQGPF